MQPRSSRCGIDLRFCRGRQRRLGRDCEMLLERLPDSRCRWFCGLASANLVSNVLASLEIGDQTLNRKNGPPGNAPPTGNQGEQGPEQTASDSVFAGLDEVDVGRTPKGHNQDRHAVLIDDELTATLDLEVQFVGR